MPRSSLTGTLCMTKMCRLKDPIPLMKMETLPPLYCNYCYHFSTLSCRSEQSLIVQRTGVLQSQSEEEHHSDRQSQSDVERLSAGSDAESRHLDREDAESYTQIELEESLQVPTAISIFYKMPLDSSDSICFPLCYSQNLEEGQETSSSTEQIRI